MTAAARKRRLRRRRPAARPWATMVAEINVTPLVDVVLVLLIIFMVVTPMLSHGIDVPLPFSRHHEKKADTGERLVIGADRAGTLYLDTKPLGVTELQSQLGVLLAKNPKRALFFKGDRRMTYGQARKALEAVHRAGATSVELGTEEQK